MTDDIGTDRLDAVGKPALRQTRALPEADPQQVRDDGQLIALWLHGKSEHTLRAYKRDLDDFRQRVGERPLGELTLGHLQRYADSLTHLSPATRTRKLSSVKSLLSFAQRIGYLRFNPGAPLRTPRQKGTLAERILEEPEVFTILALEPNARNRVMLRLLYSTGIRVGELCALTWADVQPKGDSGQVTVFGKGAKTRAIALSPATWRELLALRGAASDEEPVFASRQRKAGRRHLSSARVWQIVRRAARRAGIEKPVSPHWLRHAHASHALERGAPLHLVKETLGHRSIQTTGRYLHARPEDSSSRYLGV